VTLDELDEVESDEMGRALADLGGTYGRKYYFG